MTPPPPARRRRIIFVLPDLGRGGAQRVMLRFASALDPARYAVTVLSLGAAGDFAAELAGHLALRRGGFARVRSALPWLVRQLRELQPDAIVSVMGYLNLSLLALRPLLPGRPRILVREANALSPTLAALPRLAPGRLLYRHLYPTADRVIAPTRSIADDIAAIAPGSASRLTVCPNPVDEARLRTRAAVPRRMPGPGIRLVAAGRLTRQKGFDRLIAGFPLLPDTARLTIHGDGPERAALAALAAGLGVSNRVSMPGFSTDLPADIAAADVFVLPSRWEGLPNAALEALALGTPVVATPDAGLADVAAAAGPGALSIVPAGEPFMQAVLQHAPAGVAALNGAVASAERAIEAPPVAAPGPRPSLLPEAYRLENAAASFAAVLAEVLES